MSPRPRRRAARKADVDYDRHADTPAPENDDDGGRYVEFDDSSEELSLIDERPPHYGGD